MAIVEVEDVVKAMGKQLDETQTLRLQGDLSAIQEELEHWAHQSFEPRTVVDERHVVSDGSPIFFHWGEPANEVLIKYGSPNAPIRRFSYNPFLGYTNYGYRGRVFVTYEVDLTNVYNYMSTLKQVITRAAIASLMRPDIVRYRITNSYSVEGLSVQFDSGSSEQVSVNTGQLPDVPQIDLAGLLGLKRTVIV